MENLPIEVLEIVFHPLSKKEDIELFQCQFKMMNIMLGEDYLY